MSATATAAPQGARPRRRLVAQLWFWVLVAIAAGIAFGLVAPDTAKKAKWLADAFIQLIKTVTGPVIFVTVIIGIASLGNLARAGGLALRALGYFLCATIVALALGLLAANIVKPGAGFHGSVSAAGREAAKMSISEAGQDSGVVPFITGHLLPTSFVQPFVDNEILQILVLAILTAAAISMLPTVQRERIVGGFESASRVIFGIIRLIMWAAPLGAFGGMAFTVAQFGSASLSSLALLMVTFWGTCAVFVCGVLGLVAWASGFSIFKLIRLIKDELLIILGTSSSETVLPRLLAKLEAAGASRQTVGVVIPTGYSFNLDGTCIYLTLGAMFIIQASGQSMSVGQQIALAGLMVLTSKGAAGITGAGLVTLTASLQAFGGQFFSAESIAVGIALVVGIDRIMSEGRALTNAIGNSVATMVIAKWQGERDDERFHAALDEPSIVDGEVQRALTGEAVAADGRDGERADARFERDPATGAHVPVGRDAEG
ncbi:MAG: aerobic C4-dicarboxylate transport protein [Solirubrobacteraceae bacterium]|jgi:aerobic C4-dicarboxylate transport protein|nr:aerobic C4-dicarboxylate transport protein [Solirubrobacteraceae bacterium]